jgi:adenylosuccinate synthase
MRKGVFGMNKNVISVIDGEAGSCGKAKVVGEIATDNTINLDAAVTNCMPNAGHTFVDEKGNATVFRNIPVSCVNQNTDLFIGPGSAIDMEVFKDEYERVKNF